MYIPMPPALLVTFCWFSVDVAIGTALVFFVKTAESFPDDMSMSLLRSSCQIDSRWKSFLLDALADLLLAQRTEGGT